MDKDKKKIIGYKLIKEYPNSPKLHYFEEYTTGSYSKYPEYWEPIYKQEEEFKVGEWVFIEQEWKEGLDGDHNGCIGKYNDPSIVGYLAKVQGYKHSVEINNNIIVVYKIRKATSDEIKTYLISEASNRGFKDGVLFTPTNASKDTKYSYLVDHIEYDINRDILRTSNGYVYDNGLWSEIIECKLPIIGGHKGKIVCNTVVYGCSDQYVYHIVKIKRLISIMKESNIMNIIHESGHTISIKDLEKIVECIDNSKL